MWTSDFLEIDGIKYNLPVKTDVTRNFDLLDKFEKAHDNLKWHVFELINRYPLMDIYPVKYYKLFGGE